MHFVLRRLSSCRLWGGGRGCYEALSVSGLLASMKSIDGRGFQKSRTKRDYTLTLPNETLTAGSQSSLGRGQGLWPHRLPAGGEPEATMVEACGSRRLAQPRRRGYTSARIAKSRHRDGRVSVPWAEVTRFALLIHLIRVPFRRSRGVSSGPMRFAEGLGPTASIAGPVKRPSPAIGCGLCPGATSARYSSGNSKYW